MRKVINYFFVCLGIVYVISAILLAFNVYARESYEMFFSIELSRSGYILYKALLGLLLITIAVIDQRRRGKS